MSDVRELFLEFSKSQAQFAYFVLGAAGSAIAFAVHETKGQSLHDTPWPIGAAVALWGLSFLFGCSGLSARQSGIATNANYLKAVRGMSSHMEVHPEIGPAVQQAKDRVQRSAMRAPRMFNLQLWAFGIGAIAFVSGHMMEMAAIPPVPATTQPPQPTKVVKHQDP